jgi:DNA-directed RNA polymerase specialized sigma subunit
MADITLPDTSTYVFDVDKEIDKMTVRFLLNILNEREKELLILWYWYGYTTQEIADYISDEYPPKNKKSGITAMAIRIRIRQIHKKLQKHAKIRT